MLDVLKVIVLMVTELSHGQADEARSTNVSHKELFDWFKIDQEEFDNKFVKSSDLDEQLAK